MNKHNLPLLFAIHIKSHQPPFNSCWNICVFQKPTPAILNSLISSFCTLEIALIITSDNFQSIFLPSSCSSPGGSYSKLLHVAIFTACSNTFIFWLKPESFYMVNLVNEYSHHKSFFGIMIWIISWAVKIMAVIKEIYSFIHNRFIHLKTASFCVMSFSMYVVITSIS